MSAPPPYNQSYPSQNYGQPYGQPYPQQQQYGYPQGNAYPAPYQQAQPQVVYVERDHHHNRRSDNCCLYALLACLCGCCIADCCD